MWRFKSPNRVIDFEIDLWILRCKQRSQGINESANFRFPCRDCPSYLASAETVGDLLLPAETVVLGK